MKMKRIICAWNNALKLSISDAHTNTVIWTNWTSSVRVSLCALHSDTVRMCNCILRFRNLFGFQTKAEWINNQTRARGNTTKKLCVETQEWCIVVDCRQQPIVRTIKMRPDERYGVCGERMCCLLVHFTRKMCLSANSEQTETKKAILCKKEWKKGPGGKRIQNRRKWYD